VAEDSDNASALPYALMLQGVALAKRGHRAEAEAGIATLSTLGSQRFNFCGRSPSVLWGMVPRRHCGSVGRRHPGGVLAAAEFRNDGHRASERGRRDATAVLAVSGADQAAGATSFAVIPYREFS